MTATVVNVIKDLIFSKMSFVIYFLNFGSLKFQVGFESLTSLFPLSSGAITFDVLSNRFEYNP